MDFEALRTAAAARLPADVWENYQGTADGAPPLRDERAWQGWDLVPRALTPVTEIDQHTTIGTETFASPLIVAPTAAHGALEPEGELVTRRATAAAGLLMGYSNVANIAVARVGAAAEGPWWAQIYLSRERDDTATYVERAAAAGATALVLTVDAPTTLTIAPFRERGMSGPAAVFGNYDKPFDPETAIGPAEISWLRDESGLPVWVKGVMSPADALLAADAGAAGVIVSNHGRRILPGVAPTAAVLPEIVSEVGERLPVLVDGGIRHGADVVRALALGATAVGIGRPVLWALGAGGREALDAVLAQLMREIASVMAAIGAPTVAAITPEMVRPAWSRA